MRYTEEWRGRIAEAGQKAMGAFLTKDEDYQRQTVPEGGAAVFLKRQAFDRFNDAILELGALAEPAIETDAICAMFDLAGFTRFCGTRTCT